MFRLVLRFFSLVRFAFQRLRSHIGLTTLALLGVVLSVGLVCNGSFFSQAVEQVLLDQELAAFSKMTGRPPFSTSVYTFPSSNAPISLPEAEELGKHVASTLSAEVGLTRDHLGVEVHSGNMMLQPAPNSGRFGDDDYLSAVDMVYIAGIAPAMDILLGEPLDEDGTSGEALDVWMHSKLASKMGVNVGELFEIGLNLNAPSIPIRVVGIWQAADLEDNFWFENPDGTLQNALIVRRADYIQRLEPIVPAQTWYLSWHIILDDTKVYPENAKAYLDGFTRAKTIINKYLPDARINTPPLDPLEAFVNRGDVLTILLLSFNLPAFAFLLYFLMLSSTIIANWQQRETATLVGRGLQVSSILTLTFVEQLLLFIVGYPLGVGAGMLLSRLMGYTASFLSFTSRAPLPISLRGLNVPLTLVALGVAMFSRLIPAARATRLSAIDIDRERARPQSSPWWQRAYLDFILLLPTWYAYQQLTRRGTLAMLVQDRPEDLYQDPLLILVPALFIVTLALLTLRIFPWAMRLLDMLAGVTPWSTPHLALRQLGRQSQVYVNPLLLVIVALGLGVYMISMAASLDKWLVERIYYQAGSDLSFALYPLEMENASSEVDWNSITGEWIPTPDEFRELPGVLDATRVGNYTMSTNLVKSGDIKGRFLVVDRTDFARVGWFREDFADEPLGGLMNALAQSDNAILVSEDILERNHLLIGDVINIRVGVNYAMTINAPFTIVGTYKYFPTVYEDERITFIGNLDYLSFYFGIAVPHDIWLVLESDVEGKSVLDIVPGLGARPVKAKDAPGAIAIEQAKQERVGVFGTLTIGFLAAVVMAGLGLLIYTYASLRERLKRFTILRAIGLLRSQIMGQVVLEYATLTAYGAIAGALIGKFTSDLFIPFFRITGQAGAPLPPLIPIIAQEQVVSLVSVFVSFIVLLEVLVIARALSDKAFTMLKELWG